MSTEREEEACEEHVSKKQSVARAYIGNPDRMDNEKQHMNKIMLTVNARRETIQKNGGCDARVHYEQTQFERRHSGR